MGNQKLMIKIFLIIAFVICLFDMPYWFYQIVRIFGTIGFVYLAYQDYKTKIKYTSHIFITSAILLNPIIKIHVMNAWQVLMLKLNLILISLVFEKEIQFLKYSNSLKTVRFKLFVLFCERLWLGGN